MGNQPEDGESLNRPWWVKSAAVGVPGLGLAATLIPAFPSERSGLFLIVVFALVVVGSCLVGAGYHNDKLPSWQRDSSVLVGAAIVLASAMSPGYWPSSDSLPDGVSEFTSCEMVVGIPRVECEALTDLYGSTNGTQWQFDLERADSGWLETASPCSEELGVGWVGVECTGGQVTGLVLANMGLSGELSESLGDLGGLQQLILSNNGLSGQPPRSLMRLAALDNCDLAMNRWSEVDNTFRVFLDERCGGWAARPFTSCSTVQGLPVPECQALVDIWEDTRGQDWQPNQYVADPGRNWAKTDSPCAGDEQGWRAIVCRDGHVQELYLGNMNLRGRLPDSVGDLIDLRKLHIYENSLAGDIPSSLSTLQELEDCYLWNNDFELPAAGELWEYLQLNCRFRAENEETGY